jgi:succinyl-diaminopimelate desuccinylase
VLRSGSKINMVPDQAVAEIDVRLVPGRGRDDVLDILRAAAGEDMELSVTQWNPPVATPPDHPWVGRALALSARRAGAAQDPGYVAYFTDAGVLVPALGAPPTLLLGPGEPGQAHQTDEWCSAGAIRYCADLYEDLVRDWFA